MRAELTSETCEATQKKTDIVDNVLYYNTAYICIFFDRSPIPRSSAIQEKLIHDDIGLLPHSFQISVKFVNFLVRPTCFQQLILYPIME